MPAPAQLEVNALATTEIIHFLTDGEVSENGYIQPPCKRVDGYRYINLFVKFDQAAADDPPVDLGVVFAFDTDGSMGARCYVNLEGNVAAPQATNFIDISGKGAWSGKPWDVSTYIARIPVLGPFITIFVENRASVKRTVSVWGYLVS